MMKTPWARWAWMTATMALVSGCATGPSASDREAQQVMQRANQRWQALIDGETKVAYELNAPSYRAVVTQQSFRRRFGNGPWIKAEALKAECELEKCNVRISMTYQAPMIRIDGGKMTTSIQETWIKEDGQWWYLPRP